MLNYTGLLGALIPFSDLDGTFVIFGSYAVLVIIRIFTKY